MHTACIASEDSTCTSSQAQQVSRVSIQNLQELLARPQNNIHDFFLSRSHRYLVRRTKFSAVNWRVWISCGIISVESDYTGGTVISFSEFVYILYFIIQELIITNK